jgi:hypothetical protein
MRGLVMAFSSNEEKREWMLSLPVLVLPVLL